MDTRERIARRVALELHDNSLVNLGIGLPTMVARYVPEGRRVHFQSENGIIGFGAAPPEGMEDESLTDAGGAYVSAQPGAVAFDSAMSIASWNCVTTGRNRISGDTSGAAGSRIQAGARQTEAGS